jgi:very-short-patch-repair endonuclease
MKREALKYLIKQASRKLRKEQTESEAELWQLLRNRKLLNKKFLRQYPIAFVLEGKKRFFIADFYCHEAGLVVELDGAVHLKRKDYDKARDQTLKYLGLKTIRFSNEDIARNLKKVITSIAMELNNTIGSVPSLIKRGESKG